MSELNVQNENELVRENWLWSGKSQGKVREFCFTQIVDTLLLQSVVVTMCRKFLLRIPKTETVPGGRFIRPDQALRL